MDIDFCIRPMCADDIAGILQVQQQAYAVELQESPAVLLAKWQRAASCCLVACTGKQVQGYLFSHPWHERLPPPLHAPLPEAVVAGEHWFVHDLALAPTARGHGLAARLWRRAREHARAEGCRHSLLVALADAAGFWQRQGYQELCSTEVSAREKLAGYGPGARLMHCRL